MNSRILADDKLHHWNFIPYLIGHGGGKFSKDPPGNLTPTWDTPEAATLPRDITEIILLRNMVHSRDFVFY